MLRNPQFVAHESMKKMFNLDFPELPSKESCYVCKNVDVPLLKCSTCLAIYYCSSECQKGHWKSHKKDCVSSDVKIDLILEEYLEDNQEINQDRDKVREAVSKAFVICRNERERTMKFLRFMDYMPYMRIQMHLSLADLGSFVNARSSLTEGILYFDYHCF